MRNKLAAVFFCVLGPACSFSTTDNLGSTGTSEQTSLTGEFNVPAVSASTSVPEPSASSRVMIVVDADIVSCIDARGIYHLPNPAWTPGALCSPSDADFDGFRYKSHVAHCARNITGAMKDEVARMYNVPKSDYHLYEFDHYIPLAAGGANSTKNLWPQPIADAHDKDKVEDQAYHGLESGKITIEQAVDMIKTWKPALCR